MTKPIGIPVMCDVFNFTKPETDDEAVFQIIEIINYLTREKTFAQTIHKIVRGVENRSYLRSLICNYKLIVQAKLALMRCIKLDADLLKARKIFRFYGLTSHDVWLYVFYKDTHHAIKLKQKLIKIGIPTLREVNAKVGELIFNGSVRKSIHSNVRRKLSYITKGYNIDFTDMETDVITAVMEGFYLNNPYYDSDQHIKASAVQTANNKINKIISYYQTDKRRTFVQEDGKFQNNVSSTTIYNDGEQTELEPNDYDHNYELVEMRASVAKYRTKETNEKRRRFLDLILGRNYVKFLAEQSILIGRTLTTLLDCIEELGVKKFINAAAKFCGIKSREVEFMKTQLQQT